MGDGDLLGGRQRDRPGAVGDLAMEQFSIARDQCYLIPFVRAAMALQPDLRQFASP